MDDTEIIRLYWDRDERAIPATAQKYGHYCSSIARNILGSNEDAEECVNDTYLKAWHAMPPHRPMVLSAFLGKITRNLALNRYRHDSAGKRGGGERVVVLDEIGEMVSDKDNVEQQLDRKELLKAIDEFLDGLPEGKRKIFVCRYWYFESIPDLAHRFGMTENHVSVTLSRLRRRLNKYLSERGFEL